MVIALDYDGTITKDPELWCGFSVAAVERGHQVYIVTQRYEREPVEHSLGLTVIYCDRKGKASVMNQMGIRVDVWIDDNPMSIMGLA